MTHDAGKRYKTHDSRFRKTRRLMPTYDEET